MKVLRMAMLVGLSMGAMTATAAGQTPNAGGDANWQVAVSPLVGASLPLTVDGIKVEDPSVPLSLTIDGGQNKRAVSLGGRIAVFRRVNERFDLGLAGDVVTFRYDGKAGVATRVTGTIGRDRINDTEISGGDETRVTMMMATLIARWRLGATADMPGGRWLPYLGVGAGDQYANIRTAGFTTHAPAARLIGGLEIPVSSRIGLFGEYRYEHLWDEVKDGSSTTKIQLRTNHVAGGLTVRF